MSIVLNIIGFILSLFLFWKKLKEDYLPNEIFSTYFYILILVLISFFFSKQFASSWWFWIVLIGYFSGLFLGILKFRLNFFESFEASFLGFLVNFSLFLLGDSVKNLSLVSFLGFTTLIILIGFFQYIDLHYKNISWYKSGRVGFTGLISAGVFFILRLITSIFYPSFVSFAPQFEIYLSALASLIFFGLTYNLSRSEQ